jgi:hypothetical protein
VVEQMVELGLDLEIITTMIMVMKKKQMKETQE